jgi:hypothetical protein
MLEARALALPFQVFAARQLSFKVLDRPHVNHQ